MSASISGLKNAPCPKYRRSVPDRFTSDEERFIFPTGVNENRFHYPMAIEEIRKMSRIKRRNIFQRRKK